ncbi:MAG: hypothetical protein JWN79_1386 [Gemmatimonadetes bacterium]|nr:hypothetical protein [Gemmatimonadota bacterium]
MRTLFLSLSAFLARPSLAQDAGQLLDTVHVTSRASTSGASATRSVEVLTGDDLRHLAGRSLAERLGRAVGVDAGTRSPAQADLSLRGSSFNQVVILVDGVRVSDVQSGHYALDLALPLAMIKRVEILRGAGAALYGSDAVGGVVNIVTRDDDAGEAGLRVGSFGSVMLAGLTTTRQHGWRLALGGDADRSSGHRDGTDYAITQLRATVDRPTSIGQAHIEVGQGVRHFGAANFYSPFPSEETTRSTTASVRLEGDPARPVTVSGGLHTRRHSDVFTLVRTDPARYQNEHRSWETGGEMNVRAALSPRAVLVLGADLLDARLRSLRLGDHDQFRRAAFGEVTLDASHAVTVNAALRGDHVQDVGGFFSPTLGLAVPLAGRAQLRGSVSRGFRAATWTERYYRDPANIADSSLAVERFWSGEMGLRAAVSHAFVDVALFERRGTDLIDWARPAGSAATVPWRTMNFASAQYRGVEATISAPALGGVDWVVRASGLRFDAATAAGLEGKYALRPLTRSVGLTGTRALGESSRVTVDALRARRAGEEGHTQIGAHVTLPLTRALQGSLDVVNVSNGTYLDAAGAPVAGRSAFVGLAWNAR